MTDNDIIKAKILGEAHDLIIRQKAEIEALKLINSTYEAETKRVRDIAIKKFSERLKKELTTGSGVIRRSVLDIINDTLKEMTEEQE